MGNALPTFSEHGFGYAVEKAPSTQGWSWPVFDEIWNYGFPLEMRHFARCVRVPSSVLTRYRIMNAPPQIRSFPHAFGVAWPSWTDVEQWFVGCLLELV